MIKCLYCQNYEKDGNKKTCKKCKTKTVYGVLNEPFLDPCRFFIMTEREKAARAYVKAIKNMPIDDTYYVSKSNKTRARYRVKCEMEKQKTQR